jgi:hypothetical protein
MRSEEIELIAQRVVEMIRPLLAQAGTTPTPYKPGVNPKFLRIRAAAKLYDWPVRDLREKCLLGRIPGATKVGKEWRIPVASMEGLLDKGVPGRGRRA